MSIGFHLRGHVDSDGEDSEYSLWKTSHEEATCKTVVH